MRIHVRFFASLREQVGRAEQTVQVDEGATASQVWSVATGAAELPPSVLVAVNMEYAEPGAVVRDGDEVAFFPPVTGGCHEG